MDEAFARLIKLGNWNIAHSKCDARRQETKWGTRENAILKRINDSDIDLLTLTELRDPIMDEGGSTISEFTRKIKGGRFNERIYRYDPSKRNSMALGIFFNPQLFEDLGCESFVLDGTTRKVIFQHLRSIETKSQFYVGVTHLPVGTEELKESCVRQLLSIVKSLPQEEAIFLAGDFNFFVDKDGEHHDQIMNEGGLTNIMYPIKMGDSYLYGDFIGFHDDPQKKTPDTASALCMLYTNNPWKGIVHTSAPDCGHEHLDNSQMGSMKYPSDHLFTVSSIDIQKV